MYSTYIDGYVNETVPVSKTENAEDPFYHQVTTTAGVQQRKPLASLLPNMNCFVALTSRLF